jgi:hypothetical protein
MTGVRSVRGPPPPSPEKRRKESDANNTKTNSDSNNTSGAKKKRVMDTYTTTNHFISPAEDAENSDHISNCNISSLSPLQTGLSPECEQLYQ